MNSIKSFLEGKGLQKLISIVVFVGIAYSFKNMIDLVLLTFIFSFIFYNIQSLIHKKLDKFIRINDKLLTIIIYLLFVGILTVVITTYIPVAIKEIVNISKEISRFDIDILKDKIDPRIFDTIKNINLGDYIKEGGNLIASTVTNIGKFGMNFFISLLLSLFLLLERNEISKFGKRIEKSKVAFIYEYFKYFGYNFLNSFGKVMQLQIIIASVNAILSTILLTFMGFTNVIGLGFMVFAFGLIPVAGVVMSFIPLAIIGFSLGGFVKVMYVISMVLGLHGLESYVLNPKLMSMKTKLPAFFTFTILIVSEHLFGVWGLLIGLPLFIFLMDMLGIKSDNEDNHMPIKH